MAAITLRSLSSPTSSGVTVKNAPLTNVEVDTNFDNINASKVEKNGSIPFTGKLVLVSPTTAMASLRLVTGDDPTNPIAGDFWNNAGILKFATANDVVVNLLASDNLLGTTDQIVVTTVGDDTTLSLPQSIATTSDVRFDSLGIGLAASGVSGRIEAAQDVVAYSSSDINFKKNITAIENALEKVVSIRGVMFDWDEEQKSIHGYEGRDTGVIAQEVQEVLPEVVMRRADGFLGVKYDKMIGLLVEAIKDLNTKLENCQCNCQQKTTEE